MIDPRIQSSTEKLVLIAQKGFDFLYENVLTEDEILDKEDPYEDFLLIAITWSTSEKSWVVSFDNTYSEFIHVFIKEDKNNPNSYSYYYYSFDFEPDYN